MFIRISDLCVDLVEFHLQDINLEAERGDYIVIIGPTGSGKSVVLETIAGFYSPLSGRIVLDGEDITNLPPEKRGMSIVYQDYVLFPHMNVYDNIAYGLRKIASQRSLIDGKVKEIAKVLGIDGLLHRYPNTLSGGEAQRVAIARALVVKPRLLLMDEPFSALDVRTKDELRSLLKSAISRYETTTIHVTHDLDDVWSLSTKVIIMKGGRILQMGTPEEVFRNPANGFVANFIGTNILRCRVISRNNDFSVLETDKGLRLFVEGSSEVGDEVTIAIRPEHIMVFPKPVPDFEYNMFQGTVSEVRSLGYVMWMVVEVGGLPLKIALTTNAYEMLGLSGKKFVYVAIKSDRAKIISGN